MSDSVTWDSASCRKLLRIMTGKIGVKSLISKYQMQLVS